MLVVTVIMMIMSGTLLTGLSQQKSSQSIEIEAEKLSTFLRYVQSQGAASAARNNTQVAIDIFTNNTGTNPTSVFFTNQGSLSSQVTVFQDTDADNYPDSGEIIDQYKLSSNIVVTKITSCIPSFYTSIKITPVDYISCSTETTIIPAVLRYTPPNMNPLIFVGSSYTQLSQQTGFPSYINIYIGKGGVERVVRVGLNGTISVGDKEFNVGSGVHGSGPSFP